MQTYIYVSLPFKYSHIFNLGYRIQYIINLWFIVCICSRSMGNNAPELHNITFKISITTQEIRKSLSNWCAINHSVIFPQSIKLMLIDILCLVTVPTLQQMETGLSSKPNIIHICNFITDTCATILHNLNLLRSHPTLNPSNKHTAC